MDQLERSIATDPLQSCWVNASAGSGKTKLLVDRILRLILSNNKPNKILAITFTNAAASEMKERIIHKIQSLNKLDDNLLKTTLKELYIEDAESNFTAYKQIITSTNQLILEDPSILKIQTIHSFCHNLIKQFCLEAGLNPDFKLIDNISYQTLLKEVSTSIILKTSDDTELKQALSYLGQVISFSELDEVISHIITSIDNFNYIFDHYGSLDNCTAYLKEYLQLNTDKDLRVFTEQFIKELITTQKDVIIKLATQILTYDKSSNKDIEKAQKLISFVNSSDPHFFDYIYLFFTQTITPQKQVFSKKVISEIGGLEQFIDFQQAHCEEFLLEWKKLRSFHHTKTLLTLVYHITQQLNHLKSKNNLLDFNDLIKHTTKLLNDPAYAWINFIIYNQIDHILVDEAQDTAPLQWQVILKLFEENFSGNFDQALPKTLFIVGDEKQSIYSFQGADAAIYFHVKQRLKQHFSQAGLHLHDLTLQYCFRSTKEVLHLVDQFTNNPCYHQSLTYQETAIKHLAFRPEGGLVTLWPLINYRPLEEEAELQWPDPLKFTPHYSSHQILAKFIAEQIKEWLDSGRILPNHNRPVAAQDIMILVRKRNELFYEIINELNKLSIPNSGVDKFKLKEHIVTKDILALLKFILLPIDDLNLACLLKSPFFNLNEDQLIELCIERGSNSLWDYLKDTQNSKWQQLYYQLNYFCNHEHKYSPYKLLSNIFVTNLTYQSFFQRMAKQSWQIIQQIINLAEIHDYQFGLQQFVYFLDNNEIEVSFKNNDHAVRILTIHGSKGLESNIVILADTCQLPNNHQNKFVWKNDSSPFVFWKEASKFRLEQINELNDNINHQLYDEYLRLLYVAITRARDELYIASSINQQTTNDNSWYKILEPAFKSLNTTGNQQINSETLTRFNLSTNILSYGQNQFDYRPFNTEHATPNNRLITSVKEFIKPTKEEKPSEHTKLGTLLHKILEYADSLDNNQKIIALIEYFEPLADNNLKQIVINILAKIDKLAELKALFSLPSFKEYPLIFNNNGSDISIRIDRLIFAPDHIIILDFKLTKNDLLLDSYLKQLDLYQIAISAKFANYAIKKAILWLTESELEYIN
ncbi:UvrD-helicase domain-containing protein [Rickettsiales endosymbiont of Stachyamoeba lipophora]|uniref:UvrD-helicase domain-containing protein n=1 Tax=Rickettsiales endosymbiont of Stachyamoeba lipophora TaxID=2486578 RepID=UPI000F646905|nr:UvrD-helicase domain-containing protein [Rickettsiales endosymbiont of Stachyamoeba lipophora]AZL15345.1 hypothetical protein EF513_02085 [Rickettsiales endosymbiont of Stachyamoeba lipophora]